MATFMVPFNGRITGMIHGVKKTIDHAFSGGNGREERFATDDPEWIEIMRQNTRSREVLPEEVEGYEQPESLKRGAAHVGAVTTHPGPEPEEAEEPEIPVDPKALARTIKKLQEMGKPNSGKDYYKVVVPMAKQYGIDHNKRKRDDVYADLAMAHLKALQAQIVENADAEPDDQG